MKVTNHRLEGVAFQPSPNVGGMIDPTGAIMHYTAGYNAKSAIKTLTSPAAKVSAHLVIDRDGTITQLVPFNRVAWHAGPSAFGGRAGCNNFTIGFEFVNPGFFQIAKDGTAMDWEGKNPIPKDTLAQYDLSVRAPDKRIGGGIYIWPKYTDAQIAAGLAALKAIHAAYGLEFVTGHEDIDTRKWKTDPGDAFPMSMFKQAIHGALEVAQGRSEGAAPMKTRWLVNASKLNVRTKPDANAPVVTVLSGGSEVAVVQDLGAFSLVEYAPGKRGYLADQFLKAA